MTSSSSTDPVERSWDLSLYELHRTPQEVITDETEIAVSARSLQSELTCPICLDMLTTTMTTKECLHRFCAECIITALRSGNKECPTCRKKLVSKRSLRADPNFDRLVEKIFPNRDEYEAHQESILESLSKSHSQNFITSINHGIKAQMAHAKAVNRKKNYDDNPDSPHHHHHHHHHNHSNHHTPITGEPQRRSHHDDDYEESPVPPPPKKKKKLRPPTSLGSGGGGCSSSSSTTSSSGPAAAGGEEASDSNQAGSSAQEIEIVFKLHPQMVGDPKVIEQMRDNTTRYIKTTAKALVEHLCKYLAMRIALDLANNNNDDTAAAAAAAAAAKKSPSGGSAATANGGGPSTSSSSGYGGDNSVKDLTIFISPGPGQQMVPLATSFSLTYVNEKYWKVNKPMELFYLFRRA